MTIKTKHFTEREFVRSETANKHNINNSLQTSALKESAQFTLEQLEKVRTLLGEKPIIITSGYRCLALNKKVGGSQKSQHMSAEAVDFILHHMSVKEACNKIANSDIEFCQLINEFDQWIHISFIKNNNQRGILTARKENGKKVYLRGLIDA